MTRFWPRSLSSQIAVLIAIALFVAQAINFSVLFQVRRQIITQQVVGPALTRIIDVIEQPDAGAALRRTPFGREPVRIVQANPIPAPRHPRPTIEAALRAALVEAGIKVGTISTDVRPFVPRSRTDRRPRAFERRYATRFAQFGAVMIIAVQQPGRGWLVLRTPWPRSEWPLIRQLIVQTLVLYVIVLLPVLWGSRRISRPLQSLASAALRFRPGESHAPLDEQGPQDVRAVITAFNALRLRVTAMLDEKDQMLGAIGHDLRTPLAALRVRVESVEDEGDRARMIETIEEMNQSLDDILSLARLGRPSEPVTESDLTALVEAVVEDFMAIGKPVSFQETARIVAMIRPSLMRRAVQNLIENAVKYGNTADVRIVADGSAASIVIADQGPGIPIDKIETVFDPFTRLETSRNRDTGGSGLGLALARAIVREAGGDIMLENRRGGGLNAIIRLPRG